MLIFICPVLFLHVSVVGAVVRFHHPLAKEAGLALWSAILMVNRSACDRRLVLEWPDALSARMIRDGNRHLCAVVFVVGFRQLLTDSGAERVGVAATLVTSRDRARIDRDPDEVVTGWDRPLPVAGDENEILPAELPDVDVRPAFADPLLARHADRAAAPEVRFVVGVAGVGLVLLNINHAEAAL